MKQILLNIIKKYNNLEKIQNYNIYSMKEDELLNFIFKNNFDIQQFKQILKEEFNIEYLDKSDLDIQQIQNNLNKYNELKKIEVLPICIDFEKIIIGVTDIMDYEKINKVKIITGIHNVECKFINKSLLVQIINNKINNNEVKPKKENSINTILEDIINFSVTNNCSDIHIEPYELEFKVKFRKDGDLFEFNSYDISLHKKIISKIKIIGNVDISKKMMPQDGHFKKVIYNRNIDFRISTMPTIFGEKVVIRIIYSDNQYKTKESLGFFDEDIKLINEIISYSKGLILITGATGNGKSTTLISFIKDMDYVKNNIVTVEDPVENIIKGVTQISLNEKAGLTFDNTLDYILRQDPDVIMIGEIRNLQTAEFAIKSSITGHLVLSTLHTSNAISTISRLLNMGIEPYLIVGALKGVISQKLVKKICNSCKESRLSTPYENEILKWDKSEMVYFSVGCKECNNAGTNGRVVLYEILQINNEIKNYILNNKSLNNINIEKSFENNIKKNLLLGIISIDEAIKLILEVRYELYG